MNAIILCNYNNPQYLIISEKVPSLVYYSHLPITIMSLIVGIYLFSKNIKGIANQIVLIATIIFSIWVFLDSIFWASNRSDVIMFVWAIQILIEPLIHLSILYLLYVLTYKKDLNFYFKLILLTIYLPIIILAPTKYILTSFNIETCLSQETIYSYYSYLIESIYTLILICIGIMKYKLENDKKRREEIIYLTLGMAILLLAFSWGAIVGSFTENWNLAQFGLFGMPIFLSLLLYTIIKYKSFPLPLIGRNVLVFTLWILIGSLIIIPDIDTNHIITGITFIISLIIGIILIRSTRREVTQLKHISSLASSLETLNSSLSDKVKDQTQEITRAYELEKKAKRELEKWSDTKDQFIMIAQHNLRIPVTNINNKLKSIFSLDQKEISKEVREILNDTNTSIDHLARIADDFKDIARLKIGSQILKLNSASIKPLILEILQELKIDIENMNLTVAYPTDDGDWPNLKIDSNKIRDVLLVIIENAIRYNIKNGKIEIKTQTDKNIFKIIIENTGVGISLKEKENLLNRTFYRGKYAQTVNPTGMGIGLSVSRSIIEAHHGTITINSDGENMGARVILTLPVDFLVQTRL